MICAGCRLDVRRVHGCNVETEGDETRRIRYGGEYGRVAPVASDCVDCGCGPGALHHVGCTREECAKCHQPRVTCRCFSPRYAASVDDREV